MNPGRLIAAVAALAVGFGVTLVGVVVGGDGAASTVASTPTSSVATTVVPDAGAPVEEDVDDLPPPAPTTTIDATTVDEVVSTSPQTPRDVCEPVLVVLTDDGATRLLVEALGDYVVIDGEYILTFDDIAVVEVAGVREVFEVSGVIDDAFGVLEVTSCDDDRVYVDDTPDAPLGSTDDSLSDATGEGGSVERISATASFPCSPAARRGLEAFVAENPITVGSDTDLLLVVLARLLATPEIPSTTWFQRLSLEFDQYLDLDGDCGDDIEEGFVAVDDAFFCSAVSVSADDRLFEFLDGQLSPTVLDPCRDLFEEGAI